MTQILITSFEVGSRPREDDDELRSIIDGVRNRVVTYQQEHVSVETLTNNTARFIDALRTVFSAMQEGFTTYELAQVELNVALTAGGELTLVGIAGVNASLEGGIKLIFKKGNSFQE
jgi:hypothetical protein